MPRKIGGHWWADKWVLLPAGSRRRIRRKSPVDTKKGAEAFERQLVEAALAGESSSTSTPSSAPRFDVFAAEFLKTYAAANNRRSEIASKEQILSVHLIPRFGLLRLDEIGARDIESYKADKLGEGYAVQTVRNHLTVLRKLLVVAHEWGLIRGVPPVKRPKPVEKRVDFLTFEDAARLVETLPSGLLRALVEVALDTGLRAGELTGLRWHDVHLDQRKLVIANAFSLGQLGPTKSGKVREVPMTARVFARLSALPRRGAFVFCRDDGTPFNRWELRDALERACRRTGFRHVHWHLLRHTFASHLVMRGASLKVVQELLGHGSITVTMRYAHLTPAARQDAIALLEPAAPAGAAGVQVGQHLGSEAKEAVEPGGLTGGLGSGKTAPGSARLAGAAPGLQNRCGA